MTEQEPEQAGTEEAGSKAAEQAGPTEQAAEHAAGLARRRGLPAERARLAGLRHAAFHWRGSVRGRARGGRRAERVGASAASRAGVGLARHKGKRRQGGEQNDERTKPQTKRSHRSLSRRFRNSLFRPVGDLTPDGVHIGTTKQEFKTYPIVSQAG